MKKILLSIFAFSLFFSFAITMVNAQKVGEVLTGQYTYFDPEGDPEYGSTYQWYREETPISGATSINYTVVAEDEGHTLYFEVTPRSLTGISPGVPFKSAGIVINSNSSGGGTGGGTNGGIILPKTNATPTPVVITYPVTDTSTLPKNSFISPVDGKTVSCPAFNFYLKLNAKANNKEEVKIWQAFLNKELGLKIPLTGYYGSATINAVKAFQSKYADEILKPWDLKTPTGYTYKSTRYKANNILGCKEEPVHLEGGAILNY